MSGPTTLVLPTYKRGRDVERGDMLHCGSQPFVVSSFEPYEPATGGPGRIARNALGVGMVVFDNDWTLMAGRP